MKNIKFPFEIFPTDKKVLKIKEGVYWVKLLLPSMISHVNVYILDDIDGIGLGLPGSVSPDTMMMINGNTQVLINKNLVEDLKTKLKNGRIQICSLYFSNLTLLLLLRNLLCQK